MLRFSVVVFVGLRYPTNNNITVATGVSTINPATDSCTMEALYHKHVHLSTHTHTHLLTPTLTLALHTVQCSLSQQPVKVIMATPGRFSATDEATYQPCWEVP